MNLLSKVWCATLSGASPTHAVVYRSWPWRDLVAEAFVSLLRWFYRRLPTQRGLVRICRLAAQCAGHSYLFPVKLCDGRILRLDPAQTMVMTYVVHGDLCHEGLERYLVRRCLDEGSVFYDIGANVGWYTTLALSHLRGRGFVCAFEPNPAAYRMLVASVARYQNVKTYPMALSDRDGQHVLYVPACGDMASMRPQVDACRQVACHVDRLARLVAAEALPYPDLIKLDVEGAELSVLRGAEALLGQARAPVILFEYPALTSPAFGYRADTLLTFIRSLPEAGYDIFSFAPGPQRLVPMLGSPEGPMNLIAVPRLKHSWITTWLQG